MKIHLLVSFSLLAFPSFCQFDNGRSLSQGEVTGLSTSFSEDLDSDGDADLIFTSRAAGKLAWYENYGQGNFKAQQVVGSSLTDIRAAAAADINNDGKLDLISGSQAGVSVFINNGSSGFGNESFIGSTQLILSVAAGRLHGDTNEDIVAGTSDGELMLYRNLGSSFAPGFMIHGDNGEVRDIQLEDIDGDGDRDILTAWYSFSYAGDNAIRIFLNDGNASFTESTAAAVGVGGHTIDLSDIDGDGLPDLVSASVYTSKIVWYKNLGGGVFGPEQLSATMQSTFGAVAADIDQDGDNDILATGYVAQSVVVFTNDGTGVFTEQFIDNASVQVMGIGAADFNEDGFPDVFTSSNTDSTKLVLYTNDGTGAFAPKDIITAGPVLNSQMEAIDYDMDGLKDLFISSDEPEPHLLWCMKNLGDGTFGRPVSFTTSSLDFYKLVEVDIDGDYDKDLVFGTVGGTIGWFENTDGMLSTEPTVLTAEIGSPFMGFLLVDDIDADGNPDILVSMQYINEIALYPGQGGGAFGNRILVAATSEPHNLQIADLNNDGLKDIVFIGNSSSQLSWIANLGSGTFGPVAIVSTSYSANALAVADINNDGLNDLVFGNINGYVALNTGNGLFAAPINISTDISYPGRIVCVDTDGDGDLDILSNSDQYDATVWLENDGNGNFPNSVLLNYSNEPNAFSTAYLITADLDNDGDPDLVTCNAESNVMLFLNYFYISGQVTGKIYVDLNNNGERDLNEPGAGNRSILSNPASDQGFTYMNGNYFLLFSDEENTYQISPAPIPHWHISSDSLVYNLHVDNNFTNADSLDFGLSPDSIVTELHPELTGGFPRCNTIVNYWIDIANTGTTTPSGIISLQLDPQVTYISASATPTMVDGQMIFWQYSDLTYFDHQMIQVQVQLPDFESMGDELESVLQVSASPDPEAPVFGDTLRQTLVCAYDPNDKSALPAGTGTLGMIPLATTTLEYLVRFQNTGNDTAMTVVIKDQLDPNLDWQTLEPLSWSHPVQVTGNQDGEMQFAFRNIMLPDSNVNEVASHGFIKYRIKLKPNLPNGTQISNTAYIFFDQNPPVVTNTAINTLTINTLALEPVVMNESTTVTVYPNPFSGSTTVAFNRELSGEYDLTVYTLLGEQVYSQQQLTGTAHVIALPESATGMYLLRLVNNQTGERTTARLVAE